MFLFVLFVFVFTEVHDSAYRWLFIGSHFYQIQTGVARSIQRIVRGYDTELSSIWPDHANRRNANLHVHSPWLVAENFFRLLLQNPFQKTCTR